MNLRFNLSVHSKENIVMMHSYIISVLHKVIQEETGEIRLSINKVIWRKNKQILLTFVQIEKTKESSIVLDTVAHADRTPVWIGATCCIVAEVIKFSNYKQRIIFSRQLRPAV